MLSKFWNRKRINKPGHRHDTRRKQRSKPLYIDDIRKIIQSLITHAQRARSTSVKDNVILVVPNQTFEYTWALSRDNSAPMTVDRTKSPQPIARKQRTVPAQQESEMKMIANSLSKGIED